MQPEEMTFDQLLDWAWSQDSIKMGLVLSGVVTEFEGISLERATSRNDTIYFVAAQRAHFTEIYAVMLCKELFCRTGPHDPSGRHARLWLFNYLKDQGQI